MVEALNSKKSPENVSRGTAFRNARELYGELGIETKTEPFRYALQGKAVFLDNGASWIRIEIDPENDSSGEAYLHVVDSRRNTATICRIFSEGTHTLILSLPPIRVNIGDFAVATWDTPDMPIKIEGEDGEQAMSAIVDWARESIDKGTVTEPPYRLKFLPREQKASKPLHLDPDLD